MSEQEFNRADEEVIRIVNKEFPKELPESALRSIIEVSVEEHAAKVAWKAIALVEAAVLLGIILVQTVG